MLSLALGAAAVCLLLWAYAAWGFLAVVGPAGEALSRADDQGAREAASLLETTHIFAGYLPYTGFGDDKAARRAEQVALLVDRGHAYSDAELALLQEHIAFYLPAFIASRVERGEAVVGGDHLVLAQLLARWRNALRSNVALAIHLTVVTLILGSLYLAYRRLGIFARFNRRPQ